MLTFAGWVNRSQQNLIEYLQEENRVLREHVGGRRLRFTDGQRRRLAAKAKAISRKGLFEIGSLVTPDTLLRWHRKLIAKNTTKSGHMARSTKSHPLPTQRVWSRRTGKRLEAQARSQP
jgi:hypothetical protein